VAVVSCGSWDPLQTSSAPRSSAALLSAADDGANDDADDDDDDDADEDDAPEGSDDFDGPALSRPSYWGGMNATWKRSPMRGSLADTPPSRSPPPRLQRLLEGVFIVQ